MPRHTHSKLKTEKEPQNSNTGEMDYGRAREKETEWGNSVSLGSEGRKGADVLAVSFGNLVGKGLV